MSTSKSPCSDVQHGHATTAVEPCGRGWRDKSSASACAERLVWPDTCSTPVLRMVIWILRHVSASLTSVASRVNIGVVAMPPVRLNV